MTEIADRNIRNQKKIIEEIQKRFLNKKVKVSRFGPLEINCYSICFWIETISESVFFGAFYVKIPKIIFYDKSRHCLLDITAQDRVLARDEYSSLRYLSESWPKKFKVFFVQPKFFIEEYNAIVTERVQSDFLFKEFRKCGRRKLFETKSLDSVAEKFGEFGSSLYEFHQKNLESKVFRYADQKFKLDRYLNSLREYGVNFKKLNKIRKFLDQFEGMEVKGTVADNFKGIDIRQIFSCQENLVIIDPGKISENFIEATLARFIVTCRIVYWGTPFILLKYSPSSIYEENFLRNYCYEQKLDERIKKIFLIKETLKHWVMAHSSLKGRNWNFLVTGLLKKIYIDRFYVSLMNYEIKGVES